MMQRCLIISAVITVATVGYIAGELDFLSKYRDVIFRDYLGSILQWTGVFGVNVLAATYFFSKRMSLRKTGRKLEHMDSGLRTDNSVFAELSERLARE